MYDEQKIKIRSNILKEIGNNIAIESDSGSVLVGDYNFRTRISNGLGDGITLVGVFDKLNAITIGMHFEAVVEGKFHIFSYDCLKQDEINEDNIVMTLNGRYGVFSYDGIVVFEKWSL